MSLLKRRSRGGRPRGVAFPNESQAGAAATRAPRPRRCGAALRVHGHLLKLIRQDAFRAHGDYFSNADFLGKLPGNWVAGYIADKSGLSLWDWAKVKSAAPDGLRRLVWLQLPTGAKLPPTLSHKSVAARAQGLSATEVGG